MGVKFSTKELQRIIAQPGYGIVGGELPDDTKDAKRNKFNAVRCEFNGIHFDSKAANGPHRSNVPNVLTRWSHCQRKGRRVVL